MGSGYDDSAVPNDPISPDPRESGPLPRTDTETLPPAGTIAGPPIGFSSGFTFSGRYEIQEEIGSGGFAVVYRARDLQLRRDVALKILRADQTTPSSIRRLQREAALARDVESPHLIRIFELGEHLGLSYLALELLSGGSLRERIDEGPLPVGEVVRIGRDLLRGLGALHAAGVVHRDIKPGNVLFLSAGEAKLADLGVALPLDPNETRTTRANALVGTVDYLSPEQALGQDAGPRSDLYSLGVLLFEALTGSLPFPKEEGVATLVTRLRSRPLSATRLRPEVPKWLARFLARLLEVDPSRRYPSAEAALADLEANRGPLGVPWRRAAVAGLLLAAAALVAWRTLPSAPRFRQVRPSATPGESGIEAIDAEGHVLWRKQGVSRASVQLTKLARVTPGAEPVLATIRYEPGDHTPAEVHELSLLDPETGTTLDRVALRPATAPPFPTHSDWYWPEKLTVLDLDDDGIDEILVSYNHYRSWPSYTILYEPALHRPRYAYLAGGHSILEGARDFDGDGRLDLLFSGMSSSLGTYPALAAVRLEPGIGERPDRQSGTRLAVAPGVGRFAEGRRALLWYRLLADPEFGQNDHRVEVDDKTYGIRIPYFGRPQGLLAFRGNRPEEPVGPSWGGPEPSGPEVSWLALEEALRLQAAGDSAGAWREITRGLDAARESSDTLLIECLRRFRARFAISISSEVGREVARDNATLLGQETLATIDADAPLEASAPHSVGGNLADRIARSSNRELEQIHRTSGFPSEVAFDAARAFHLAGRLEEAIAWYRKGMPSRFRLGLGGQDPLYFLQGMVFSLTELDRFDDALREIESFSATFSRTSNLTYDQIADLYRFFVAWRRGAPSPPYPESPSKPITDMLALLNLEWRRESRVAPEVLLPAVQDERQHASQTRGALLALEAELLARLGRTREAQALVEEAISQLRIDARTDPTARAFLAVALDRAKTLRTLGNSSVGS